MKVIIAGSRSITNYELVKQAILNCPFKITEIVSGCAKGVDTLGEVVALELKIPVMKFPADWDKHGRAAGPIRNERMGDYADALIAVHNNSKGTQHMIRYMKRLKKRVYEVIVDTSTATIEYV